MKRLILLGTAVVLISCGKPAPVPKSPDQALFDIQTTYVAALSVVVNYGKLPLCPGDTWGIACHNGKFLVAARVASNAVAASIDAAHPLIAVYKAIASPSLSDTAKAQAVVSAATSELGALLTLANTISGG